MLSLPRGERAFVQQEPKSKSEHPKTGREDFPESEIGEQREEEKH